MRIAEIEILGKKYDITFSNRVLMRMEKENLDTESTEGTITLLSAMMEAGDRLAKLEGREGKGFLTVDDLLDRCSLDDIMGMISAMNEVQQGERNVETADSPKNAESTQSAS